MRSSSHEQGVDAIMRGEGVWKDRREAENLTPVRKEEAERKDYTALQGTGVILWRLASHGFLHVHWYFLPLL